MSIEPVITSLNQSMRCGVFTNAKGEVLVVHDQEIVNPVQWVEYNKEDNKIHLVYEDGGLQDLGLVIDSKMQGNLMHGMEVKFAYLQDKKVQSVQVVTLIVQDY